MTSNTAFKSEMSSIEDIPLEPPPHGQTSNFKDPKSVGPAIVVLCSVFLSLMWPIFLLRIYSAIRIIRVFGWEDGEFSTLCLDTLTDHGSFFHRCCGDPSNIKLSVNQLTLERLAQQHPGLASSGVRIIAISKAWCSRF